MTVSSGRELDKAFGPYRLVRRIATGGMAEIYLAKTRGIGGFEKYVALKMIHPNYSQDESFIEMLIDEAKISVQLGHVNVAQIFDLGRVGDIYYITMEFIDGADLFKLLRTVTEADRDIPIEIACHIAKEVLSGLHYAHCRKDSRGQPLLIVHRDVSPQNVLISFSGEVKIVDFGIAKAAHRMQRTAAGVIKGKYYYMSPEQAWGDPLDHRSDVFSAGILLHEMLTGRMLYLEDDMSKLLDRVRRADISPPSRFRNVVPAALDAIVMKALARRVQDRYATAQEFQVALEQYIYATSPSFSTTHLAAYVRSVFGAPKPLGGDTQPTMPSLGSVRLVPDGAVASSGASPDALGLALEASGPLPPRSRDELTAELATPEAARQIGKQQGKNPLPSARVETVESRPRRSAEFREAKTAVSTINRPPQPTPGARSTAVESAAKSSRQDRPSTQVSDFAAEPGTFSHLEVAHSRHEFVDENSMIYELGADGAPISSSGVRNKGEKPAARGDFEADATEVSGPPRLFGGTVRDQELPTEIDEESDLSDTVEVSGEQAAAMRASLDEPRFSVQRKGAPVVSGEVADEEPTHLDGVGERMKKRAPKSTAPLDFASRHAAMKVPGVIKRPVADAPSGRPAALPPPPAISERSSSAPNVIADLQTERLEHSVASAGSMAASQPDETLRIRKDLYAGAIPYQATQDPEVEELPQAHILTPKGGLRRFLWGAIGVFVIAAVAALAWRLRPVRVAKSALEIVSEPQGARVSVDGKALAQRTPVKVSNLTRNRSYHIVMEMDRYERWDSDQEISNVQSTVRVVGVLKPISGTIRINTVPRGATVTVNGLVIGSSPVERKMEPEPPPAKFDPERPLPDVIVGISLAGFKSENHLLKWDGRRSLDTTFTLEPDLR